MNIKKSFLWRISRKICWTPYQKLRIFQAKYCIKDSIENFGNDFPDKTFYIIRRRPPGTGLLSNSHWVLNHIIYAILKGYIPVVDMQNYKTFYNEESVNLPKNAWEYYFEQPCGYSLEDITKAKNVIFGDLDKDVVVPAIQLPDPYLGKTNISEYYKLVSKYCKINSKTTEQLEKKKKLLFENKSNVLGVLHRGTDYKTAKHHLSPASLEQMTEKVKQVFQQEKFDYIFLCTEEQKAVDTFREVFAKEKVIVSDSERIKDYNDKDGITADIISKSFSAYKNGFDYLTDLIFLSQCDGIIASKVNGTLFALGLNNNKYRFSYLFDLGINS